MSYHSPYSPGQKRKRGELHSGSNTAYLPVAPSWGSSAPSTISRDPTIMALVPRIESEEPLSGSEGQFQSRPVREESETSVPDLIMTAEDMIYKTCRTYFHRSDDILEYKQNASNRAENGLTLLVTRPDGQVRKYYSGQPSESTLSPRQVVSRFAIRNGILKFLESGQDPISEGKTLEGVEASVADRRTAAPDVTAVTTPSDVESLDVREIEQCCRVWRTDKVTPLFLPFEGNFLSAHWGALCDIKLSTNTVGCWSVPSIYLTPAKALAAVASAALDDGIIELVRFGNGQFAPNQGPQDTMPKYYAVQTDWHSPAEDCPSAPPSVSLEAWLEDIPSPYPHGISVDPDAGSTTASNWIESVMSNAVAAGRASVQFVDINDASLTRCGCLLRIDFQDLSSKSWFIDAIFATKKDARSAVSFQAICLGGFDAFASRWTRVSARTSSRPGQKDAPPPSKRIKLEPVELKIPFEKPPLLSSRRLAPTSVSPTASPEIAPVPSASSLLGPRPKYIAPPASSSKQKHAKHSKSSPGDSELVKSKKAKKKGTAQPIERVALEEFSSLLDTELALAGLPAPQYRTSKNKKGKFQASVIFNFGEGRSKKTYIGPPTYSDDEQAKLGALQVAKVANILQRVQQWQGPASHPSPPLSAQPAASPTTAKHLSEASRFDRTSTLPSPRTSYGPGTSYRESEPSYRAEHRQIASIRHGSSQSHYIAPSPESSRYLPSYPDRRRSDRWDGTRDDDSFGSTTGQMFGWGDPTPKRGTASWQAGNRYAWRTIPSASPVNEHVRGRDYEPLQLPPIRLGISSTSASLPTFVAQPSLNPSTPARLTQLQSTRQTPPPASSPPLSDDQPSIQAQQTLNGIEQLNMKAQPNGTSGIARLLVSPSEEPINDIENVLLRHSVSPAPSHWSPSQVLDSHHRPQSDMDFSESSVSGDDADDETSPEKGPEPEVNILSSDIEVEHPASSRVEAQSSVDGDEADRIPAQGVAQGRSSSDVIVISSRSPTPSSPGMNEREAKIHRLPPSNVQMALVNYPPTCSLERVPSTEGLRDAVVDRDDREDGEIADRERNVQTHGLRGRRERGSRSRSPERRYWERSQSRSRPWGR